MTIVCGDQTDFHSECSNLSMQKPTARGVCIQVAQSITITKQFVPAIPKQSITLNIIEVEHLTNGSTIEL